MNKLIFFILFFSALFYLNNAKTIINFDKTFNNIDGFGASTAWQAKVSDKTMEKLFVFFNLFYF